MEKKIIPTAAILRYFAIILGAFGAHALKKVSLDQLATFDEVRCKPIMLFFTIDWDHT
jgi:uncharacterized membrane protein YgdD (TMEM256/DUF423 family)